VAGLGRIPGGGGRSRCGCCLGVILVAAAAVSLALVLGSRDFAITAASPDGRLTARVVSPGLARVMAAEFVPRLAGRPPDERIEVIGWREGHTVMVQRREAPGIFTDHAETPLAIYWAPAGDRFAVLYRTGTAVTEVAFRASGPSTWTVVEPDRWLAEALDLDMHRADGIDRYWTTSMLAARRLNWPQGSALVVQCTPGSLARPALQWEPEGSDDLMALDPWWPTVRAVASPAGAHRPWVSAAARWYPSELGVYVAIGVAPHHGARPAGRRSVGPTLWLGLGPRVPPVPRRARAPRGLATFRVTAAGVTNIDDRGEPARSAASGSTPPAQVSTRLIQWGMGLGEPGAPGKAMLYRVSLPWGRLGLASAPRPGDVMWFALAVESVGASAGGRLTWFADPRGLRTIREAGRLFILDADPEWQPAAAGPEATGGPASGRGVVPTR
jgi:hypothetical protein